MIAALAVAIPAYVVTHPPHIPPPFRKPAVLAQLHPRIVAPTELPPVEPTAFVDLAPEDARAYNATVPFSTEPNPAARAFAFAGTVDDRARATDCLAAAVVYEAGDDTTGERAVAQVVLNRLRHPAFPKTVCGVVFEGAERTTGCQFTFTCDGALTRWHPSDEAWKRARMVAAGALSGRVDKPVGYATHYHTDWVVPYWQASLDKIAAVGTHLFFRWSGWWGTPPAFNRRQAGAEPVVPALATLSQAHRSGADLTDTPATLANGLAAALVGSAAPALNPGTDGYSFAVTLDPRMPPDNFRQVAERVCGDRDHCLVLGWVSAQETPRSADAVSPEQQAFMSFSYLRDRSSGFEKALWNCTQFKRAEPRECMKPQLGPATPPPAAAPQPAATSKAPAQAPEDMAGVRRRGGTPSPTPSPTPTATPSPAPPRH